MKGSDRQQRENQAGEIAFRRKLYQQQVGGEAVFADEFDAAGIEAILQSRMAATRTRMAELQAEGLTLSPYVEIGAERGQRSLVMENDLHARGAAVDLSFDMLKSCGHYRRAFGLERMPLRVCANAYNLPFRSASVPFVFCYETLHHFPSPVPIVQEILRVAAPGAGFLLEEEPYRKVLHCSVYTGSKMYSARNRRRGRLGRWLDFFFARTSCNETEHGVIENHDLSLATWRQALAPFADKRVRLDSLHAVHADLFRPSPWWRMCWAYGFGGSLSGLCRKAGALGPNVAKDIESILVCPTCLEGGKEVPLQAQGHGFACSACAKAYPLIDGVAVLLAYPTFKELYPDFFRQYCMEP